MAHGKLLQCSTYWEIAVLETKCTWRWENLISRSYACKYFDISVKKEKKKSVYGSLLNALRISNELPLWKIQVQLYSRREYPISLCPIIGLGNDNTVVLSTLPLIKEVLHVTGYGLGMYVIRSNTTNEKWMPA